MNESKPWFVKITGRMQWQIKPYGWQGWAMMGVWAVLQSAICSLLFIESVRERWWIVTMLGTAITIPLIILAIHIAVPIEEVRAVQQRRTKRARPPRQE